MDNQLISLGVTEQDGKIVVSSHKVAEVFEKRHNTITRIIKGIITRQPVFSERNFALAEYLCEKVQPIWYA